MAAETEFAGSAQLLVQSWAVGSEKRQQVITAMLETRQGYLWIGTNKGLVRFDGFRFTDFPYTTTAGMSQGGTNFTAMWEDSFGVVWAGTEAGATLLRRRALFLSDHARRPPEQFGRTGGWRTRRRGLALHS